MNFTLDCECGSSITVRSGDAGTDKLCECGETIRVPSYSELMAIKTLPQSDDSPLVDRNTLVIFGVAIVLLAFSGLFAIRFLLPIGVLMFISGRLWLTSQILREMTFLNAIIVFVVPFMPTLFLFKRFDIAWRPFLFGAIGLVVATAAGNAG